MTMTITAMIEEASMPLTRVTPDEARARANIYSFLAEVFGAHPTMDHVRGMRQMATELGITCPNGFSVGELDQEYMELFVVPGPRYVAPYESVFRDRWPLPATLAPGADPSESGVMIKGLVMGKSTRQVQECYLRAGILPEDHLPDHIVNELRFMAYLWEREAEVPDDEALDLAQLRERFREEHLLEWIGELREKVEENSRLEYYGVALRVAEAIIRNDV